MDPSRAHFKGCHLKMALKTREYMIFEPGDTIRVLATGQILTIAADYGPRFHPPLSVVENGSLFNGTSKMADEVPVKEAINEQGKGTGKQESQKGEK